MTALEESKTIGINVATMVGKRYDPVAEIKALEVKQNHPASGVTLEELITHFALVEAFRSTFDFLPPEGKEYLPPLDAIHTKFLYFMSPAIWHELDVPNRWLPYTKRTVPFYRNGHQCMTTNLGWPELAIKWLVEFEPTNPVITHYLKHKQEFPGVYESMRLLDVLEAFPFG